MRSKRVKLGVAFLLLCCLLQAPAVSYAACKHGHHFGGWQTKRLATCRQTGLEFRYCRNCDHWEKREVSKLRHEADEWKVTVYPTCAKRGSEEATCTVCKGKLRRNIDMVPHTYGELTVVREPKCTQEGKGEYVCTVCGKKKREAVPKLGHDWVTGKTTKAPTCVSAGSGEQTCARCGRARSGKIGKLGHDFATWTVTREPSGAKKGLRESTCTRCGETRREQFFPEGTLYQDMEPNEAVLQMQIMLRDLGYYDGGIRSGKFGANTGKAVARFQRRHSLAETGVADEQTLTLIRSEWEKATGKNASQLAAEAAAL